MFLRSLLVVLPAVATAFMPPLARCSIQSSSALSMAPRFDVKENKWNPSNPEEGPEAGYGLVGTALRAGPIPLISRIFVPDDYEQAVLKFMAVDNMERIEAQANMDVYLRNPSDWQFNRINGYEVDYVSLKPQQIVLTLLWSCIVAALAARGVYCLNTGENFWQIFGLTSRVAECVQYNSCIFDGDKLTGMRQ